MSVEQEERELMPSEPQVTQLFTDLRKLDYHILLLQKAKYLLQNLVSN